MRTPPGRGNRWRPSQLSKGRVGGTRTHVGEVFGKITSRYNRMHNEVADIYHESITVGSAITSAPGQPVQSGRLLGSYERIDLGPRTSEVVSREPYAWGIENAIGPHGPIQLRSEIGGFHSIAISVSNNDKIARAALDRLGDE